MEPVDPILTPIIQYGFAGFAAVLLAIVVWCMSKLLGVIKGNTEVISANTNAISHMSEKMDQLTEIRDLVRHCHDRRG